MSGRRLSAAERSQFWQRWKAGESITEIARGLGRPYNAAYRLLEAQGGLAPAVRRRGARSLTWEQREEISRGLSSRSSLRQIARRLGRAPSSVSREVARNGGAGRYRASLAEGRAWEQARRPQRCKLARHPHLAEQVAQKLMLKWSPQQISRWLARQGGAEDSSRVSHETIYRSLFIQARGVLKKELIGHLRVRRRMRRARHSPTLKQRAGMIQEAVSIRERPAEAADRAVPGHWEGDLIEGSKNTYIATLVERHSRFLMLVKVPGKDTHRVIKALSRKVLKLPGELRRSLTWDRGTELAAHKDFTMATQVKVYFCDPHSPWQRGSNENTNGLLRQYFPKGTDLSRHTQAHLDAVALQMNQRPRQTLGFETPADTLARSVASTS